MAVVTIPDPGLRLALIDEVYMKRAGDYYWVESTRDSYAAHQATHGGPTWDEMKLGEEDQPELEQFLLALPITTEDLAGIDDLCFDGDREVYMLRPHWSDGGDDFDILSLEGIEHCVALREVNLGICERCSLRPLLALPELHRIVLTRGGHPDPEVLLELTKITDVEIYDHGSASEASHWNDVVERLRSRGVSVTVR